MKIDDIRTDYRKGKLDKDSIDINPIKQFTIWLEQTVTADVDEPTAMTLSTVNAENYPDSRIVLLKLIDHGFCFFTNYHSQKGQDIDHNSKASLVFFWKPLERQVRVRGIIEKTSAAESDAYFNSRPSGSRLGAWSSNQSQQIASRQVLENQEQSFREKFAGQEITRPEHWGGYRLIPDKIEFWQGRPSRMHDRICYQRSTIADANWQISRLQP
jgi:pyridoxamine 5'-phosphate oxidase